MEQFVGIHSSFYYLTLLNLLLRFQRVRMFCEEKEYLEYVRKDLHAYPSRKDCFENNFELNALPYSVYRRSIELLLPLTNYFFRNISKHNYQQCLDLRGIEVEELHFGAHTGYHGGLWFHCGKMTLNLDYIPTNWAKCLVVSGVIHFDCRRYGSVPDIEKLDFVKKHKRLNFYNGFAEQLELLIHPGLERVCICYCVLRLDHLLSCLNKLNVCQRLETIYFCNYKVESAAEFKMLKEQLEQLSRRHPHAQIDCDLGGNKQFKIHDNLLCHSPKRGVLVNDYNFEDLLQ